MDWLLWLAIGMLVADLTLNIWVLHYLKRVKSNFVKAMKEDGLYCLNSKCKMRNLTDFGCSLKKQMIDEDGKCAYHHKGVIIQ